jgi:O-antigen chain-terminating methyltransferase
MIQQIRERVRARYPEGSVPGLEVPLPDLMPLLHARDAAEAKVAAIGSVNPRPPGPLNATIQFFKRQIARGLGWFIRDQVDFNRAITSTAQATLEALNDVNRFLNAIARDAQALRGEAAELKDIRAHWVQWREGWEKRLHRNEAHFLRSVADLNAAFEQRANTADLNYRDHLEKQHQDYLIALDRTTKEIQDRLWSDLAAVRKEYERLIHYELRLLRQQQALAPATTPVTAMPPAPVAASPGFTDFHYVKFADRFRGTEEYVRTGQRFYLPYFQNCNSVLDVGCGRGEFLEVMREADIPARGIDLDSASVEMCRGKGLQADVSDLFVELASDAGAQYDGIFAGQIVEHLPSEQLHQMVKLCAARLKSGGVLVIETPNPECLAIFATHFYIDPTHTRPVPPALCLFISKNRVWAISKCNAGFRQPTRYRKSTLYPRISRADSSEVWITRSSGVNCSEVRVGRLKLMATEVQAPEGLCPDGTVTFNT